MIQSNVWSESPLARIAQITMGQAPDSKYYSADGDGLPFLQGCAEFQSRYPASKLNCTQKRKIGTQGAILFSVRAPVGKINIADRDYVIGRGLAAIQGLTVAQGYLEQYLTFIAPLFSAASQGSTFEAINSDALNSWPVGYPSEPSDQAKIAEILSTVDRAIEQTEALIAKQERIKTGLMHDLLTRGIDEHGNIRSESTHKFKDSPLGRIPVEWDVRTIGEITQSLVPGRDKPELDGGGVPWITIPDIDELYVRASKNDLTLSPRAIKSAHARLMPVNSVIMSCVGEFGIAAVLKANVVANQQLHVFICDKNILPEWLAIQIMHSKQRIDLMATQTTIKYLNKAGCESIEVVVPEKEEQLRGFALLGKVIEFLLEQRQHLFKLKFVKTALMQDLLTGKKRVTPLLK